MKRRKLTDREHGRMAADGLMLAANTVAEYLTGMAERLREISEERAKAAEASEQEAIERARGQLNHGAPEV